MTIRKTLLLSMLSVGIVSMMIVGFLSVWSLGNNVRREAQNRVNHDLRILDQQFHRNAEEFARNMAHKFEPVTTCGLDRETLLPLLRSARENNNLTVLNVCDADGIPVFGGYPDTTMRVPTDKDSVIRKALEGNWTWGTVKLDMPRLIQEGGPALQNSATVYGEENREPVVTDGMFWWFAIPLKTPGGRICGILYGGRMLNHNVVLADSLRSLVFGDEQYQGKPVGTVTIFLGPARIATNVIGRNRQRAIGTFVSDAVEQKVLDQGEIWQDRAFVVEQWYLSGYKPLYDPEGNIIGMLYVGLLEAPYNALMKRLLIKIAGPVMLVLFITVFLSLVIIRRITHPLDDLTYAAQELREGKWDKKLQVRQSFHEIAELSSVFSDMQQAIRERDEKLTEQNRILEATN